MARHFTNFGNDTLDAAPSGWTDFHSVGSIEVIRDIRGAIEVNQSLEVDVPSGGSDLGFTFDAANSIADVDILARIRTDDITEECGIYYRLTGASGSENGWLFTFSNSVWELYKVSAGVRTLTGTVSGAPTQVANEYFYIRLLGNGQFHRARVWTEDTDEGDAWELIVNDTTHLGAGNAGVFGNSTSGHTFMVDTFCVSSLPDVSIPLSTMPEVGIYVADTTTDHVRFVDPDGIIPSFAFLRFNGLNPEQGYYHPVDEKWLWALGTNGVYECDREGLNQALAFDAGGTHDDICIDWINGHVYFSQTPGQIGRRDWDTWANESLPHISGTQVNQMFFDQVNERIYLNDGNDIKYFPANQATPVFTTVYSGDAASTGIGVEIDEYLYKRNVAGLVRVPFGGGSPTTVDANNVGPITVNPNSNKIIYDVTGVQEITSIEFDGTNKTTLVDEGLTATSMAYGGPSAVVVSTNVELNAAIVAGASVYNRIWVTGDLTYDMSAYVDLELGIGVTLEALPGYTNKPLITYDTTFADNTFQGLFRMNTGSTIKNIDGRGQHADNVADGVVQNFIRTIGANCTIDGCHIYQWCKWAIDLETNQGHLIQNNFIEEIWWSSDANDDGFEFGGYGYAIWCRGALTTTPANDDVTIIRNNTFNNCRNFIDAGSQAGNSVYVRNNVFGYASQAAMDSHSGGYYKCEVTGNWFLNRRSGQSSMRIQDVQQHAAGAYLLIENNIDLDGTNVWYFGDGDLAAAWPPTGDIFEPDPVNWDGVTPGQDYAVIDIQNNLFRQNAWEMPYNEHAYEKTFGMRATTSAAMWDFEGDAANDLIRVLPNSRATKPNMVLAGTAGYTSGWTFGRALEIPAGGANNATVANVNCDQLQMGTGNISVTIKAKQVTNTVAFGSLFHFGASSGNEAGYSVFWKNNGELLCRFSNGLGDQDQDTMNSVVLALDTFYTITVVFDRTGGEIRTYVDGVLADSRVNTAVLPTDNIICTQPLELGTGFQGDGHYIYDFIHVDKRVLETWEIAAYHNGGNSIKSKSEIFLGNWDVDNTEVIKQKISISFDQVGGLRPHRAIKLNVTEDQFHEIWKDGDHPTGLNLITNDPKLRFAVVRHDAPNNHTGIWQIPFKVNALTIDNDPNLSNIDIDVRLVDFHSSTAFMDGLRGNEFYAWRAPSGTAARETDGPYGSDFVDVAVSNLTTDETTTDTNENTPSTFYTIELPTYGDGSEISGLVNAGVAGRRNFKLTQIVLGL